jgi:hypothetical protein
MGVTKMSTGRDLVEDQKRNMMQRESGIAYKAVLINGMFHPNGILEFILTLL